MTSKKLELLTDLRNTLLELCTESVYDPADWDTYHEWLARVGDMLTDERRRDGWMAVYPIVNGCAKDASFEGTKEQCQIYVSVWMEHDPQADLIVLPL